MDEARENVVEALIKDDEIGRQWQDAQLQVEQVLVAGVAADAGVDHLDVIIVLMQVGLQLPGITVAVILDVLAVGGGTAQRGDAIDAGRFRQADLVAAEAQGIVAVGALAQVRLGDVAQVMMGRGGNGVRGAGVAVIVVAILFFQLIEGCEAVELVDGSDIPQEVIRARFQQDEGEDQARADQEKTRQDRFDALPCVPPFSPRRVMSSAIRTGIRE